LLEYQNDLKNYYAIEYNINAEDEAGNTSMHNEILFGAWSKWSYHNEGNAIPCTLAIRCRNSEYYIFPNWLNDLRDDLLELKACDRAKAKREGMKKKDKDKECIAINTTNYDGNTSLHIAASTGYTEAVKLLLARYEINAQIKNNQGKTACDIAKATISNLSAAKLADVKIMSEQTTAKIQAINRARVEIFSLLVAKNACR